MVITWSNSLLYFMMLWQENNSYFNFNTTALTWVCGFNVHETTFLGTTNYSAVNENKHLFKQNTTYSRSKLNIYLKRQVLELNTKWLNHANTQEVTVNSDIHD